MNKGNVYINFVCRKFTGFPSFCFVKIQKCTCIHCTNQSTKREPFYILFPHFCLCPFFQYAIRQIVLQYLNPQIEHLNGSSQSFFAQKSQHEVTCEFFFDFAFFLYLEGKMDVGFVKVIEISEISNITCEKSSEDIFEGQITDLGNVVTCVELFRT